MIMALIGGLAVVGMAGFVWAGVCNFRMSRLVSQEMAGQSFALRLYGQLTIIKTIRSFDPDSKLPMKYAMGLAIGLVGLLSSCYCILAL
jgi:hypothetical protein